LYKKKLTYIYLSDRINRLKSDKTYPKEFFYGYHYLSDKYEKVSILEFENNEDSKLDYFLRKLSDLPFFSSKILNEKNYREISGSDHLFLTNQRVGFSVLPGILKIKQTKKLEISVFIMGLFNKKPNYILKRILRALLIGFFVLTMNNLIFLSKGEFEFAKKRLPFFKNKFKFFPFCIDVDFWTKKSEVKKNNELLFIGNDGQRDYKFILDLANHMPDFKFNIVTTKIDKNQVMSNNVQLIGGSWNNLKYTDEFIRNLYHDSLITLIPVKNSLQPSGQSVSLQSMSCGTPVIITRTDGFWDPEIFEDDKNILFTSNNELDMWKKKIELLISDEKFYQEVSSNARKAVEINYNLKGFNSFLESLI